VAGRATLFRVARRRREEIVPGGGRCGRLRAGTRIARPELIRMRPLLAILALCVCLCALGGAADATSVENRHLRFSFDDGGRLISVYNKATSQEYYHGGGRPILRLLCIEGKALVELPMAFRSSRTHTIPAGSALTLVYGGDGVTASVEIRGRRAFVYTVTDGPPEVRRLGDSNRRLPKSAHTRGHGKANIEN